MSIEETGETTVRIDYLNFDLSLHIQMKKHIWIRGIGIIFSVAF